MAAAAAAAPGAGRRARPEATTTSSGRSGGWPQAESAVLLHRLSVLPQAEKPVVRFW